MYQVLDVLRTFNSISTSGRLLHYSPSAHARQIAVAVDSIDNITTEQQLTVQNNKKQRKQNDFADTSGRQLEVIFGQYSSWPNRWA